MYSQLERRSGDIVLFSRMKVASTSSTSSSLVETKLEFVITPLMMLALSVVSLAMLVSELSSCSYNSSCWIALVSFSGKEKCEAFTSRFRSFALLVVFNFRFFFRALARATSSC